MANSLITTEHVDPIQALALLQVDQEHQVPAKLAEVEKETPAERLRAWLANLGHNTARAYTRDLIYLAEHFQCLPSSADGQRTRKSEHVAIARILTSLCLVSCGVATTAMERYKKAMLAAGLASATVNRRLSAVNSALAELAKADLGHGRLDVDPVPHEARRDTKGPTISKIGQVVDALAAGTDATSVRDLAIILLAAQRGLRRSEIAALTLDDLRPDDCKIFVRRKGKRELVAVDIAGSTCEALLRWLDVRAAIALPYVTAVFVATSGRAGHKGKAIGDHAIYDVIKKAGLSIGATWHPHDLRHSAITEALRLCNGSLPAAQAFAGHSAPQTTSRYIDDKGRLERQAVDAMGDVFTLPSRIA